MADAIEFLDVSTGYRGGEILHAISFAVAEGEFAAVIGPNGAGKTTLLRAATGLLKPSRGNIRLFGRDVSRVPAAERARLVGVVPQEMTTPMPFTVGEIVAMGRTACASRWQAASGRDRSAVERAMVYAGVADMQDRHFQELSGGERQRAVIAMVLAQQPRLILMDEPTSHLDINHRLEVMQIVERLNRDQGITVVVVSHDLNLAAEFASRVLLLDKGRIAASGGAAEVLIPHTLEQVYHCRVSVQREPASGNMRIFPASRLGPRQSGAGRRVHVIGGGGSAEELLRHLVMCGYSVSCGVLNRGDSDARVALALELSVALEKPFAAVSEASLARARELAQAADAVVVCAVPFGPGNLANLDLAAEALAAGRIVYVMEGAEERDYTPDRSAAAAARQLLADGAKLYSSQSGLLAMLAPAAGDR